MIGKLLKILGKLDSVKGACFSHGLKMIGKRRRCVVQAEIIEMSNFLQVLHHVIQAEIDLKRDSWMSTFPDCKLKKAKQEPHLFKLVWFKVEPQESINVVIKKYERKRFKWITYIKQSPYILFKISEKDYWISKNSKGAIVCSIFWPIPLMLIITNRRMRTYKDRNNELFWDLIRRVKRNTNNISSGCHEVKRGWK